MAQIIDLRNNASLNKVRSKYILGQIFDNLQEEKKIEIVRYNKNLRKKLKIRITDYKNSILFIFKVILESMLFYC